MLHRAASPVPRCFIKWLCGRTFPYLEQIFVRPEVVGDELWNQWKAIVCLSVCLFVCLLFGLFVCLFISLFVSLSVCLFASLSVHLVVCLSVYLFVCSFVWLFVWLLVSSFVYLFNDVLGHVLTRDCRGNQFVFSNHNNLASREKC